MKIAVVSPSERGLQELARLLEHATPRKQVSLHEGGVGKIRLAVDREEADLVLVDSMCRDRDDLAEIERVTAQYPKLAVVMLCSQQTPEFLMYAMRSGVREVLESPVSQAALVACLDRVEKRLGLGASSMPAGKIMAFIPSKGGSGATFLASNLAYQLAGDGRKTLLIDLNLQFGDAALFVDERKATHTVADVAHNINRLDASFLAGVLLNVSANFGVLAAPEDPAAAADITAAHVDVLLQLAVSQYDFVVVDLGRSLDPISIKVLDRADIIFPVVQMTLPFVRDASRLLAIFRSLDYPAGKIRLLVNRFQKAGEISLDDLKRTLGIGPYKTIPNSYEAVAASVNQGRPLASFARTNPVAKALQELAQMLAEQPEPRGAFFSRLLKRGA